MSGVAALVAVASMAGPLYCALPKISLIFKLIIATLLQSLSIFPLPFFYGLGAPMDRAKKPPPSRLGGQLKLGLMEEDKKETVWEDLFAFGRDLLFYIHRRTVGFLSYLANFILSGFALTESFKFWLSRKFVRRKGQLSFPFAHATLVGVSLSLLLVTTGLGGFIFQKEEPISSDLSPSILEDKSEFVTEKSELLSTKAKVHEVQEGDTIHTIAEQYWTTVDTLATANDLRYPYRVQPGDKLTIPPIKGEMYTVRSGDTVESVALVYSANAQSIVEFNYLFSPYSLAVGSELIIPVYNAGSQLVSAGTPTGTCGELSLTYPTKGYNNLGGFTYSHRAIDFSADLGEPLFAAADGKVVAAGDGFGPCFSYSKKCNHGYGGYVFINIGGGYQIRYGHILKASVGLGEVSKGEEVAEAGQSGIAYSPHLHFELLCNGQKINPYPYFK